MRAREKSRPKGSSGHGWQCRWEQRCCMPQGQQCVRGEGALEITFTHPFHPALYQVGALMMLMSRW